MPSMPRKTLPSKSGVKFAAYKDAKDRLKKARAMARKKRENMYAALFMAKDYMEESETPEPERENEDEFDKMNSDILTAHWGLYKQLQKLTWRPLK